MSKADEMFDELFYSKIHDNKRRILYKAGFSRIEFNKNMKTIYVDNINMEELQAINEKVKELRLDRRRR